MTDVVQVDLADWRHRRMGPGRPEAGMTGKAQVRPDVSDEPGGDAFSPLEAAVLLRLQAGCITVSRITLALGVWGSAVRQALRGLSDQGCAVKLSGEGWRPTDAGAALRVARPAPAELPLITPRRGPRREPSSADRMVRDLDRPDYGVDLAGRLGVTRQQVRNLVERLHAEGRVRVADLDEPTFVVARSTDPSILLTRAEESVLSALPQVGAVTAGRVRVVRSSDRGQIQTILGRLVDHGLVEVTQRRWRRQLTTMYQLTDAGRQHWQWRAGRRQAHPIPPYPSRRIYLDLSYIAEHEPTKAHHVADALATPRPSTNALFQYFKRQDLAYREGRKRHHGFRLTQRGRRVLGELDVYWRSTGRSAG